MPDPPFAGAAALWLQYGEFVNKANVMRKGYVLCGVRKKNTCMHACIYNVSTKYSELQMSTVQASIEERSPRT